MNKYLKLFINFTYHFPKDYVFKVITFLDMRFHPKKYQWPHKLSYKSIFSVSEPIYLFHWKFYIPYEFRINKEITENSLKSWNQSNSGVPAKYKTIKETFGA